MADQSKSVVVVGVGDYVNRSRSMEDALEPSKMIYKAILEAVDDTGLSKTGKQLLITQIDSLSIVKQWTWSYDSLPHAVSDLLGVMPTNLDESQHGGDKPGVLLDEAARRVSLGQSKVAIVSGGEALASLDAFAKAKKLPPPRWTKPATSIDSVFSPTSRQLEKGSVNSGVAEAWAANNTGKIGAIHGIGAPIHIYPLYENGLRAHYGQSMTDNNADSAQMYAEFAQIAAKNPIAWNYGKKPETAESIGTVGERNRMICFPYPLLMNAFNGVNLAAANILTSVEYAKELGIPENKWIYVLGGAGTRDSNDSAAEVVSILTSTAMLTYPVWDRPNFYSAPCISRSIDAALSVSGLTKEDIDLYDFYSCFPCVPKLACAHLGLSATNPSKPITLLGGLTSFGGAGNNYSCHAFTAMVRELRKGKARNGLVLANGGVATYQAAVVLSSKPRKDGSPYPVKNPLPEVITDVPIPKVSAVAEGDATIETYTVEFGRDGKPKTGFVVGRLKSNDHRFVANHANDATLQQLASFSREPIGRNGYVSCDPKQEGRNLFAFEEARL